MTETRLPPIELTSSQVDVWFARDDQLREPALLQRMGTLLSAEEEARRQRLVFAHDRHQQLVTRSMLRLALSRYEPDITPDQWQFSRNANGRPGISPIHGARDLFFNISHARGLAALVISRHRSTGIDVEDFVSRPAPLAVARRYFTGAEADALEVLPESARQRRFFELWTLKEAYLKALGIGITAGLGRMSFEFSPRSARCAAVGEGIACWRFAQWQQGASHLLAVGFGLEHAMPTRLRVREFLGWNETRDAAPVSPVEFETSSQPSSQEQRAEP